LNTLSLNPHVERLITTITTLTGHHVALESSASMLASDAHRWEVVGTAGEHYGTLAVRADALTDPHRALYANLSRVIAHEAELRREKRALEERFRRLDQHAADLADQNHSMSMGVYRDSLTGVYRPWYLQEQIRLELSRSVRYKRSMAVIVFDVDELELVNACFGPRGGDDLLRAFAARLITTCRDSDVVARIGGAEFCAVLPDTAAQGAAELAERLRRSLESSPITIGGNAIEDLFFCTGCVTFRGSAGHTATAETLIEEAKRKLYRSKNAKAGVERWDG